MKYKIGGYYRLGTKGIWKLTNISDKNGRQLFHFGGLAKEYLDPKSFIPKKKIQKILNLTKNFKKGNLIVGAKADEPATLVFGFIQDIYETSMDRKIWILNPDGYTVPIKDGTAKKITINIFNKPVHSKKF